MRGYLSFEERGNIVNDLEKLQASKRTLESILANLPDAMQSNLHNRECLCSACDKIHDYYAEQQRMNEEELAKVEEEIRIAKLPDDFYASDKCSRCDNYSGYGNRFCGYCE